MRVSIALDSTIRRGIAFLLAQNARGYPDAIHYLTLPVLQAGGVVYQTHPADLFQRMLILDSLLDCAQYSDEINKDLVETELTILLQAKHRDVAGGWSYIPDLRQLPPDADDLGLAVQLLARTGGKRLAAVCDEALEILFKYRSYPDGSFDNWVVDPTDETPLAIEMGHYIEVIGGRGASPDVVANLLLGLVLYDRARFLEQLVVGCHYLAECQTSEGFWPSKWYWGNFYGTFRAVAALAAVGFAPEAVKRAGCFIRGSQLPDGGWGEATSDPLSTALALLVLSELPSHTQGLQRGVASIIKTQLCNGSWPSSPFIRLVTADGDRTYGSSTVTAAFCLKALARISGTRCNSGVLSVDVPELPYRRTFGGLSIQSDESGKWRLLRGGELRQYCNAGFKSGSRRLPDPASKRPGLHIIELSKGCNLSCTYCSASAWRPSPRRSGTGNGRVTLEEIASFVSRHAAHSFCVEFQGGEPLLNFPAIQYLVEAITVGAQQLRKYATFRIVSNLTLLTPATADYLVANRIDICTSLDGTEDLHNRHRKRIDSTPTYSRVLDSIRELQRRGINVGVIMVVTRDALACPEEIVDNFVALSMYRFVLNPVSPFGEAARHWPDIGLDADAYGLFWQRLLRRCLMHQAKGIPVWDRWTELLVDKIMLGRDPGFLDLASPCGCVYGQIAYDLLGNIYPCDEARFNDKIVVGNVSDNTFEEITRHPDAVSLTQASLITDQRCGSCAYRPWCGRCPVMNRLQLGREDALSEETYRCRIHKSMFDRFFEVLDEDPEGMLRAVSLIEAHG